MPVSERCKQFPVYDFPIIVGGICLSLFLLVGVVFAVAVVPGGIWGDIVVALRERHPVVRVNYTYFSLIGVVVIGITMPLLVCLAFLAKPLCLNQSVVEAGVRRLLRAMIVGGLLLLPLPVVVGAAVGEYVESQGYASCDKLFEFGFFRYVRGFVLDPQLCVVPWRLEEALQQYERRR